MKNWTQTSVKTLKRFKDSGTMNRKEGSGQPRSVTTEGEEALDTHLASRKIATQTGISCLSIRRMIKETFVNSKE